MRTFQKREKTTRQKVYCCNTGSTGEKRKRYLVANGSKEGKINTTGVYKYGITGSAGAKKEEVVANVSKEGRNKHDKSIMCYGDRPMQREQVLICATSLTRYL